MSNITGKFTTIEPVTNSYAEGPSSIRLGFNSQQTYNEVVSTFADGNIEELVVTQTFHDVSLDSASQFEAVLTAQRVEFATDFEPEDVSINPRRKKLSAEEIEQLREEHKRYSGELKTLTADHKKLNTAHDKLVDEKVGLELKNKETLEKAKTAKADADTEIADLKAKLKAAEKDVAAKTSHIAVLEKKLNKLTN